MKTQISFSTSFAKLSNEIHAYRGSISFDVVEYPLTAVLRLSSEGWKNDFDLFIAYDEDEVERQSVNKQQMLKLLDKIEQLKQDVGNFQLEVGSIIAFADAFEMSFNIVDGELRPHLGDYSPWKASVSQDDETETMTLTLTSKI